MSSTGVPSIASSASTRRTFRRRRRQPHDGDADRARPQLAARREHALLRDTRSSPGRTRRRCSRLGHVVEREDDDDVRVALDAVERVGQLVADEDVGADVRPAVRPRLLHAVAHDADRPHAHRLARDRAAADAEAAGEPVEESQPKRHAPQRITSTRRDDARGGSAELHSGLRIEIPACTEIIEAIERAGCDHRAVVGAEDGRRGKHRHGGALDERAAQLAVRGDAA